MSPLDGPARTHAAPLTALGLMSGTSMDGIDAALLVTDGLSVVRPGPALTLPYDAAFRARLTAAISGRLDPRTLEEDLTRRHAAAVETLLERAKLDPGRVDLIGFHGHTVAHRPEAGLTWQIGDGALLARLTGLPVVNDFRSADVATGGEGAPLVPLYHQALAHDLPKPLAVLNLGGVANVTWLGAGADPVAFDTGPGNALIDDWVFLHTGARYDAGGTLAQAGRVDRAVLEHLLDHPYFARPAPKSLDRNAFTLTPLRDLSPADGAATLVAFTAHAIELGFALLPKRPLRCLVTGGGRHNRAIMAALAETLALEVAPVEAAGWDGDALEAQAFAFLAVRSRRGLPLSLPTTTGVRAPTTGGAFHPVPERAPEPHHV